jgi:hypothetical protein
MMGAGAGFLGLDGTHGKFPTTRLMARNFPEGNLQKRLR